MNTLPDDGLIRVDEPAFRAWKGAQALRLTGKEFRLLAVLVREAGTVVTRERLMDEVWDTNWWGSTKTLDMHISWLRRKLGDGRSPRHIITVRGVGFRLDTDAVPETAPDARQVAAYRLPLRIDRHGQTIYDANDVLVAAAMSPPAARWIIERVNENYVEAAVADA